MVNKYEYESWPKHDEGNPYCGCKICWAGRMAKKPYMKPQFVSALMSQGRPNAVDGFVFYGHKEKPLEVRIGEDITALMKDVVLDGTSVHKDGVELPTPEPDLSAYQDALQYAIKNCAHENVDMTLYNKEWQCDDCGKYFNRVEYQKLMTKIFFRRFLG